MEKVLENIKNENKHMTWITTVSSHQPYGVDSKLGNLYIDEFLNLGYSKPLARYMSKLKTLDEAIGVLIQGLKEQGTLDDTVIVFYADHYPYGLNDKVLNEYFDYDVSINNETDRTPFIIYNTELEPNQSDDYTTYMNILPTIANLFNLDYDPRLYAGEDILSDDYSKRAYFANGSWQDEKAYYNATTGKISYINEENTYTTEEIQIINKEIDEKIKMSNLAIRTNYFKHLYDSIKENEIKETTTKVDKDTKGSS
jgi:phosphoglycerol transferase MdoB-like AlkP superfamily enzyme